jgi:hypothetical protein
MMGAHSWSMVDMEMMGLNVCSICWGRQQHGNEKKQSAGRAWQATEHQIRGAGSIPAVPPAVRRPVTVRSPKITSPVFHWLGSYYFLNPVCI